jgi:predicted ATPase
MAMVPAVQDRRPGHAGPGNGGGKMAESRSNYHVITGGPGSGKTSIIEALRARGFTCVDEVGRQIIREQIVIGGNALHWGDRRTFAELMLSRSILDYERHRDVDGPVFFDRGVTELVGYFRLIGMAAPAHFENAAELFRYGRAVFVAPPWPEIYRNDAERKQDLAEAVATTEAVATAYGEAGYELAELPKVSVAERVDFILARLKI